MLLSELQFVTNIFRVQYYFPAISDSLRSWLKPNEKFNLSRIFGEQISFDRLGLPFLEIPDPLFPENLCTDISKIVSSLYFSIIFFFCTHKYLSLTVYVVQCTDLFGLCESRAKANRSARNYLRPSRNPKKSVRKVVVLVV